MNKGILSIGIVILLIAIFFSGCFEGETKQEYGLVKITNVAIDIENPAPGETATIIVAVENCSSCSYVHDNFIGGLSGANNKMDRIDKNHYSMSKVRSSKDDIIWVVITAHGHDDEFETHELLIEVGEIERVNLTTLGVLNISHSPLNPKEGDDSVTVNVNITSNVNLSTINLCWNTPGLGMSQSSQMFKSEENNTYWDIITAFTSNIKFPKGTLVLYKIMAQDESGKIAVSPTISFEYS